MKQRSKTRTNVPNIYVVHTSSTIVNRGAHVDQGDIDDKKQHIEDLEMYDISDKRKEF